MIASVPGNALRVAPDLNRPRLVALLFLALALSACSTAPGSAPAAAPPAFPVVEPPQRPPGPIPSTDGPQPSSARTLAEWVDLALTHNPGLSAARADYEAAISRAETADALPDPRLSVRYFIDEVETRVGPQNFAVGVAQPLPWLSKLRLQRNIATHEARAAATRVSVAQNAVVAEVATSWYELFYYQRALRIMEGNRDLVRSLEQVARARYQTGASNHSDVIRAQVELGKIENDLASLADREAPLLARMNAALNRAPRAPVTLPESAPLVAIELDDDGLIERVLAGNPELQARTFDVRAAETAVARAEKAFFPDFAIGVEYIDTGRALAPDVPDSGKDPLAATFSVSLPFQRGRYRSGVRAAEARMSGERARREEQVNRLEAEAVGNLFRLRDARRQVDLYRGTLLPKAEESLAATQRAYGAGTATFADLVDAQRTLLVFELAEARAVADHHQARTRLEELIGEPLPATPVLEETHDDKS